MSDNCNSLTEPGLSSQPAGFEIHLHPYVAVCVHAWFHPGLHQLTLSLVQTMEPRGALHN